MTANSPIENYREILRAAFGGIMPEPTVIHAGHDPNEERIEKALREISRHPDQAEAIAWQSLREAFEWVNDPERIKAEQEAKRQSDEKMYSASAELAKENKQIKDVRAVMRKQWNSRDL